MILTGDWHADKLTAGFPRYKDVEQAVEETLVDAINPQEKATLYVFLGDLANPENPTAWPAVGLAANAQAVLSQNGVASIWITGNHDVLEDGSGESTLTPLHGVCRGSGKWAESAQYARSFVCRQPVFIGHSQLGTEFDVVCLPYVAKSHTYDPAAFVRSLPPTAGEDDRTVLVVGHLEIEGIVPGIESKEMARGRSMLWPVDAIRQRFGDQAILVGGHYHQRQYYGGVYFAGSIEALAFGDNAKPGYLVFAV